MKALTIRASVRSYAPRAPRRRRVGTTRAPASADAPLASPPIFTFSPFVGSVSFAGFVFERSPPAPVADAPPQVIFAARSSPSFPSA
jgi:hypothetical protein